MDQELKDSLDQIQRQLSGLSDEVHQAREENRQTRVQLRTEIQQVREEAREENHQTRILLEKQRDDTRQLAEGVMGVNERLDAFQAEMARQLGQLKSFISLPYKDLDGRVKVLESWKEGWERDLPGSSASVLGTPKV